MGPRRIFTHPAYPWLADEPNGWVFRSVNHVWTHVAIWTALGFVVGAAGTRATRALARDPAAVPVAAVRLSGPLTTGLAFAALDLRLDAGAELAAYCYLAAAGVVLATVDLLERRLPSALILPSYLVVGSLFTAAAISSDTTDDLIRSLLAGAALAGAYLSLALASRGGLGSGDVKLGGLIGLAMGWQGWPTVLTGTLLAWSAASLVLATGLPRPRGHGDLPMGPFLLGGALSAVLLS